VQHRFSTIVYPLAILVTALAMPIGMVLTARTPNFPVARAQAVEVRILHNLLEKATKNYRKLKESTPCAG